MTTRRAFLRSAAALGAAYATPLTYAQAARARGGETVAGAAALEREAAAFANPLRLPGASGLYGVLRVGDLRELRVARTEIEVLPGKRTPFLAYIAEAGGKQFLNPALLAKRSEELRVRMVNELQEPTIIHWHGLTNDARNDGNGLYVAEPGKAYEYAFKLQDDRASMYFYHPHPTGYIPGQVYGGLASVLFLEDEEETTLRRELDLALGETEIPLVLQDRTFDAQGRIEYKPSREAAFQGFIGKRLLVNLTDQPYLTAARRIYRFRVLNGANARTYRLAFLQNGRKLGYYLAGTDGGLLGSAQRVSETFISPGQRLDILLDLREAQEGAVTLATLAFDPMHAEGEQEETEKEPKAAMDQSMPGMDEGKIGGKKGSSGAMAGMEMAGKKASAGAMAGMEVEGKKASGGAMAGMEMEGDEGEPRALLRIDVKSSPSYAKKIPATLSRLPVPRESKNLRPIKLAQDGKGGWTINDRLYDAKANVFTVQRGAAETWVIENERNSMPHPMHLHGFQFRILERRGSPQQVRALAGARGLLPQDLGLIDTVLVWPRESVRIALDFSYPHPGDQDYVFHCHNLEHAEVGMMLRYGVRA
ncbi:MAG TPA: multicopper oxidase domain-containing protein [Casimicrobiaceae bacterium]